MPKKTSNKKRGGGILDELQDKLPQSSLFGINDNSKNVEQVTELIYDHFNDKIIEIDKWNKFKDILKQKISES